MADEAPARLLLIVTGSLLRAEEADRPLAYYLKQQAERLLAGRPEGAPPIRVVVVADFRWLHEEALQDLPTVSLGGPGVNALAQRWLDELPPCLVVDDHYYIQMHPDLEIPRASIWGMDNPDTQVAVAAFAQRYLPLLLERCAESDPPSFADEDEEDEDEPGFEPED